MIMESATNEEGALDNLCQDRDAVPWQVNSTRKRSCKDLFIANPNAAQPSYAVLESAHPQTKSSCDHNGRTIHHSRDNGSAFKMPGSSTSKTGHHAVSFCRSLTVASDQSWPNLVEGQKLRVRRCSPSNESFAQKLQTGTRWKTLHDGALNSPLLKNVHQGSSNGNKSEHGLKLKLFQESCTLNKEKSETPTTLSDVNHERQEEITACSDIIGKAVKSEPLFLQRTEPKQKRKNKKNKDSHAAKFPPQDTRVCLIDSSLKEKWMQMCPVKKIVSKSVPPELEKDFPDLSSATKFPSKCIVKSKCDENVDTLDAGLETLKNSKKRQRSRKDPISLNIIDILKECANARSKQVSSNIGRTPARDIDRRRLGGNILDSANPIRKRGKHRERPTIRKLSKLKLVILNERRKKQEQREAMFKLLLGPHSLSTEQLNEEMPVQSINDLLASLQIREPSSHDLAKQDSVPISYEKDTNKTIQITSDNFDDNHEILHQEFDETDLSENCIKSNVSAHSEKLDSAKSVAKISTLQSNITSIVHSRKFRDYCDNLKTSELDEAVTTFLKEIYRLQDRHYQRDPIRAHAKRRFVLGFREVKKHLMLKKLKAIVIAPDLEPVKAPGGLDETVYHVRDEGKTQQIPVIFAVGRRKLGFAFRKKVPISIIGIINPEGAENLFQSMMQEWLIASKTYNEKALELSNS